MPHKIGKKWKWGNLERSSKEDLRRVVYGIWLKNGSKGSFSNFWKTGKVFESESVIGCEFRKVPQNQVVKLLDEIEKYNENKQFSRAQFEKYFGMYDDRKSMYYGLFEKGGRCLAFSYLSKMPGNCIFIGQVTCVVHGYGKPLLEDIISRSLAVWLESDPTAGESLLKYYRKFGLEEVVVEKSKHTDGEVPHFFLKAKGKSRDEIISLINDIWKQSSED